MYNDDSWPKACRADWRDSDSFQKFHAFFAASFGRKQWREHSRNYPQALLVQSEERRNAENLLESVGSPVQEMVSIDDVASQMSRALALG